MPGTVKLHRVLTAPPEKVFRAFTDPAAYASWIPPYGFVCTVDKMENKVGGSYHASFTNFTTGNSHSFGGKYVDIKPNELLKYTVRFENSGLKPGSAQLTLDKAEFAFTRNRLTGQSINLQYESEVDNAQIGSGKKIHQAEIPQTRGIG